MIHGGNLQPYPGPAADNLGLNSGLNQMRWKKMVWSLDELRQEGGGDYLWPAGGGVE